MLRANDNDSIIKTEAYPKYPKQAFKCLKSTIETVEKV